MAKGGGWTQDDWYVDGESQIHFFPAPKRLLWTVGKNILLDVEAWGGEKALPHYHYDGMRPRPTTPGIYVISGWGPYRTRTWELSRIPWGTELKLDSTGQHLLYRTGLASSPWRTLQSIAPHATVAYVKKEFRHMWGGDRRYDRDGDGIPDVWVLNDFGPMAINYFRDPNRNRKLDAGERIMGEMIHTTPSNEGETDQGKLVEMYPSHGCIHVRPGDLAQLLKRDAFKIGELIVVHQPTETISEGLRS